MTNRLINDTIYNHIEHTLFEEYALHGKIVSRLHFITQNALAYFAFPSISTKRYIHSIGTMHMASYMYKSALINAKASLRKRFLGELGGAVERIQRELGIDKSIKKSDFFEDETLLRFLAPTRNSEEKYVYMLSLQAVRFAALVHDIGHLPFSHQVEYVMKELYDRYKEEKEPPKMLKKFIKFYGDITQNDRLVLHEAVGVELVKLLFSQEMNFEDKMSRDYARLIYALVDAVLGDKMIAGFDFGVLHDIINSTVDADRLDYINRDMLSSGYIGGAVDLLRIAKQTVLAEKDGGYRISFFDDAVLDIEHMLEMRFNLYKKVIFNHSIAKKDAMLDTLITYTADECFASANSKKKNDISMLWSFLDERDAQKRLDRVSMLDENRLISLLKEEYFKLKYSKKRDKEKMLMVFEEALFGKRYFESMWKNLNDLYGVLGFSTKEKYRFRESFGYITPSRLSLLKKRLRSFCTLYESKREKVFFSYRIVSFNLGISKDFCLLGDDAPVYLDEISTLRKRLKKSMQNTVPFYLYGNKKELSKEMREELRSILLDVFG